MFAQLMGALDRIIDKIEVANIIAVNDVGQHIQKEFKRLVEKEVYGAYTPKNNHPAWGGRTGALRLSPTIVSVGPNGVRVEFADNGGWSSVVTGQHFYPLYGLEGGYTYGRPPSNIMKEVVSGRFQDGIANEYADSMRGQGIPIEQR